jgi:uncharacterized damage-inducible protein DinB
MESIKITPMSKIPYAETLGTQDPQRVIASTPQRLMELLDGLTEAQTEARPAAGKWNLREIIAHLADCEIAWSWRLRQAYGEPHAVLQSFDQDTWAPVYAAYSLAEAIGCFKALRKWNIAFIGALTPADRAKPVTHPERGEETLWTLVEIMAGHDLHHLAALEKGRPPIAAVRRRPTRTLTQGYREGRSRKAEKLLA